MNKQLESAYFQPEQPTAFAGAYRLKEVFKKKYAANNIQNWLHAQDCYTLHVPARYKFQHRTYNVRNLDDFWESDVIDFKSLKNYNNDFSYILIIIDLLSKFAWVEILKDKSASSVANGFEKILKKAGGRKCLYLRTDKGGEYTGKHFQKVLKKHNIKHCTARNPVTKCSIAERFIRSIKMRIYRYFTHTNTRRYIDVLDKIVYAYNHSRHSGTLFRPVDVTLKNAQQARKNLAERYEKNFPRNKKKPRFRVGTLVRISREQVVFRKAYEGVFSLELFKISRILRGRFPILYVLEDLEGEKIEGDFYEEELTQVDKNLEEAIFEIEEVLETRGRGKQKEYLVRWKVYDEKFNSWVNYSEMKDI